MKPSAILIASTLTIGLAAGWVAGSIGPWSPIALIVGGLLSFAWVAWMFLTMQRDIDRHAELMTEIDRRMKGDPDT